MNLSTYTPALRVLVASLVAWAAGAGWLPVEKSSELTNLIVNGIGAIAPFAIAAYTFWKSLPANRIKTVDKLPGVKAVVLSDAALEKAVNRPTVMVRASGFVTIVALLLTVAMLNGCARYPDLAAGVKKVEESADQATATANETLDAVCAHYQLADFTFQSAVMLLAVARKPVPQKYVDAEAQAVNFIAGVCNNRPNDPVTVVAAVKKAVKTLVDIRDRFKQD